MTIPPVISSAGVTSKAGFQQLMPEAAMGWPWWWVSSCVARSSMTMCLPDLQLRSTDVLGAAM